METAKKQKEEKKPKDKRRPFDFSILITTLVLVCFGNIMVFNASYVQAKTTYEFLFKNSVFAVVGFVLMMVISMIPYTFWKNKNVMIAVSAVTFLLLIIVLATGKPINGSKRWIHLPGGFTLMPSEVAKFTSIVFMAYILDKYKDYFSKYAKVKNFANRIAKEVMILVMFFSFPMLIFIFILKQPDLSTGGTVLMTAFAMVFVAGMPMYYIIVGFGFAASALEILILMEPYRAKRLTAFIDPFADRLDLGYQVIQSLYAISSGGLLGLGIGKSRQKYFYIPEPQNDFIFAIIGEELGYIGGTIVLLTFLFLIYRCIRVAMHSKDFYASILATGLISQIAIQALINVAVATSSMPVTGIPLPFISYGGTSLMVLMAGMGIILNISRHIERERK